MTTMNDELDGAVSRAKRRFPDHQVEVAFRVCLPVYEIRLKATTVAEDHISIPAKFVLQLSKSNITQPSEIGRLLGISSDYVATATAELLELDLVQQLPDRSLVVTDSGNQVLLEGGRTQRPRNKHLKVPYDTLTKRIFDGDVGRLLEGNDVRKNGLFVPVIGPRKPNLRNISLDDVKDYQRLYGQQQDKETIIEIADIKDARLKYRDDVILIKLNSIRDHESVFAAYRAQQYLEDESAQIQRVADRGIDLVPEDLKIDTSESWASSQSLSGEEFRLLQGIDSLSQNINITERAVSEAKATHSDTQNSEERSALETQIEALETEKAGLVSQIKEYESSLASMTSGEIRLIKTEEHHHLLLDAIRKATSELTLVSAWIGPDAFDDEVCRLLAAAIGRGTHIRIAWGMGVRKRGYEAARNREKGETALNQLKRLIPGNLKHLLRIELTETHEKFIICDDIFCAWGSFNWLSYRGARDSGYRRETSFYSERQDDVVLWKTHADALFQRKGS